jgi:hypothetical protein
LDGRFHCLFFVDLGDVILLDARQHVGKQLKLAINVATTRLFRRGPSQSADKCRHAGDGRCNPRYPHFSPPRRY